jgi:hypothetical protein
MGNGFSLVGDHSFAHLGAFLGGLCGLFELLNAKNAKKQQSEAKENSWVPRALVVRAVFPSDAGS